MTRFDDVIVVGAGPAGSVAATVLARAGARVRLLDRTTFPRDKLCGDTVNPGTLAELRRLDLASAVETCGLRIDGMRVTGPGGVTIEGRYPEGSSGRALLRRDLDWALLEMAVDAGAQFEPAVAVRHALVEQSGATRTIIGVTVAASGRERALRAPVTIAADGRRSTLAFSLGLARHPRAPRRWAIGAYYEGAGGLSSLGEMHIGRDGYIGVAPVPGNLANVCLVRASQPGDQGFGAPSALLSAALERHPRLRDRFAGARLVRPPVVLGPLAVDVSEEAIDGLLLAGDSAGFIDPMTGDGLRFAVRGGVLAADAALNVLAGGWDGVHARLRAARRREFGAKWRFNRTLRATVASPVAVRVGAEAARVWPGLLRRIITAAGDCRVAARGAV
jgi:flavin-dependent dehydrogenase